MKKFLFVFLGCCFLVGCADVATSNLRGVRNSFANDNFVESADKFAEHKDIQNQNNLELLITGLAQFQAKNYKISDKTFEEFNKRNINTTSGSIAHETKKLVFGQMATEYKPSMMDSLFVSYYQIWDAVGENRRDDVRVIINQSYARQQDMSREYADLVQKNTERINKNNNELMTTLQNQNSQWAAYTDIMNPALMYLSGIWFLNAGDFNDAVDYLKRANGMAQSNKFITTDLSLAEHNQKPRDTTWIFVESGFAPMLKQETLSFPVISGKGVIMASIAVAEPVFWNGSVKFSGALPLADVNAMFMTEFNQYRINDALRAWVGASARAIAQAAAYNSNSRFSELLGLGTTIYSMATTNADVRSWATLPENISVLRLKTADLIDSNLNAMIDPNVKLPTSGNYLIYVRLTNGKPVVHIFKI